jgi:hypothetical protein
MPSRDSHGRFVKDTDRGYSDLFKRLQAKAKQVTVGIHDEQAAAEYEDGVTVGDVATFNELGLGVPRRSFIVDWQDESDAQHKEQLRSIGRAVVDGSVESVDQALDRFGVRCVGEVQQRIKAGIDPPDDEETVRRKGSSTPLIDKGKLWTSVSHKVSDQDSSDGEE